MANKVFALTQSKKLRVQVALRGKEIVAQVFDMTKYIARIEQIALREGERLQQADLDIDTIVKSDLLRLDYYNSPQWQRQSRDDSIRRYVRSWANGVERRKLFPAFHPAFTLSSMVFSLWVMIHWLTI